GIQIINDLAFGNLVLGNAIFANGGLGIDINNDGPTANDALDADNGPNSQQNYPVLTSVLTGAGGTTIQGTLHSTPNTAFRIELFVSDMADPTGFGEGQTYLGFVIAATDAQGNASFTCQTPGAVSVGKFVSATATDLLPDNTSEFSLAKAVAAAPVAPA